MADYYKTLGVDKTASDADIKKAYRKLAMQYHPDRFANKPDAEKKNAEAKFKEINHAYDVLSDSQKKSNYDQFGDENGFGGAGASGWHTAGGAGGFGGFEDIFSNIFSDFTGKRGGKGSTVNRAIDGEDIILSLTLTFKEAAFGCQKDIKIKRYESCLNCKGTGAKNGSGFKTCPHCNGTGQINTVQNTIFGRVQSTQTCPHCNGTGKIITEKCSNCGGKGYEVKLRTIHVKIPAGISEGRQLTYHGEGHCGKNGGSNGNVIILIKVKPHKIFSRQGYDLHMELPISIIQATLGCVVHVPTLNEPVKFTIPESTQTNTVFRIKGKGIKYLQAEQYGDLYFKVVVDTPKGLSLKQKRLLTELESTFSDKQYAKVKKYHDTLKKES